VSSLGWMLDGVLVLLLLGLALRIMLTRNLFEAIVLFIAFGLSLALAWVRLGAPDVALAEAALGAGVTGALFLNAYQRLAHKVAEAGVDPALGEAIMDTGGSGGPPFLLWGLLGAGTVGVAGLVASLAIGPARDPLLPAMVAARLDESGVSNPVTAVLLNFRAYDTLLEIAVLVAAMVAVWSLDRGSREFARDPAELRDDPVLDTLVRWVVPIGGTVALYLVWAGAYDTGGAFQAGALLAGLGVLLAAGGLMRPVTSAAAPIRVLGVMGLVLFAGVGLAAMPWTGTFLTYPEGAEYPLILLVEGALTVSIAVILVELFVDVPAVPQADPTLARVDPTGDPLGRTVTADGALIRTAEEDR
jgi:multisubunit Na+/H+ antiporter MnhB subunit